VWSERERERGGSCKRGREREEGHVRGGEKENKYTYILQQDEGCWCKSDGSASLSPHCTPTLLSFPLPSLLTAHPLSFPLPSPLTAHPPYFTSFSSLSLPFLSLPFPPFPFPFLPLSSLPFPFPSLSLSLSLFLILLPSCPSITLIFPPSTSVSSHTFPLLFPSPFSIALFFVSLPQFCSTPSSLHPSFSLFLPLYFPSFILFSPPSFSIANTTVFPPIPSYLL
jgi:hypothetical protein